MPESVVIVGGGLAAVSAATTLRRHGYHGRVTIVGDEPHLPYDRPPLSKAALVSDSFGHVQLHSAQWYADKSIDLILGVAAAVIDPDAGLVTLSDGRVIPSAAIVLATGGRPRPLPISGSDHPAVHLLRTRDQAARLRSKLRPGARLLVLGAGLIGAEVTSSAVALGYEVTLADPAELPLANAVGTVAATYLHKAHQRHGVHVHNAGLATLHPNGSAAIEAVLSNDETVQADVVLIGIGITPNTELAVDAAIACDSGVLADPQGRTDYRAVWAVGDAARPAGPHGPMPRIEHWDHALRSGERAARSILGLPPAPARAPWFWTDRYGTHLEMTGAAEPDAEVIARGDAQTGEGGFTVLFARNGFLVGAVTLDRPNDSRAAQRLIDRAVPVQTSQLASEKVSLPSLLGRERRSTQLRIISAAVAPSPATDTSGFSRSLAGVAGREHLCTLVCRPRRGDEPVFALVDQAAQQRARNRVIDRFPVPAHGPLCRSGRANWRGTRSS